MNLEALVTPTLVGSVLVAVTGGIAKVWQLFQQGRADCLERCAALIVEKQQAEKERDEARAEAKAEKADHWKTALALASLQGKLERERVASSSPPPR